jgi:hypothetical protein
MNTAYTSVIVINIFNNLLIFIVHSYHYLQFHLCIIIYVRIMPYF